MKTGITPGSATDDFERYVAIWSKAVDTQMHFNEMSVKSRQLGLTFVAAALGVAVVLMSQQKDYSIDVFHAFNTTDPNLREDCQDRLCVCGA